MRTLGECAPFRKWPRQKKTLLPVTLILKLLKMNVKSLWWKLLVLIIMNLVEVLWSPQSICIWACKATIHVWFVWAQSKECRLCGAVSYATPCFIWFAYSSGPKMVYWLRIQLCRRNFFLLFHWCGLVLSAEGSIIELMFQLCICVFVGSRYFVLIYAIFE